MEESPKKKRKRQEEPRRPQSELAIDSDTVKFKTAKNIGEWGPIIVHSPGLSYESRGPMEAYVRPRSSTNSTTKQEILLHSANHPKLDFVAREEKAGDAGSLLNHYIAVHDPKTGDTQVIAARSLVLRSTLQSARLGEDGEQKLRKTAMESRVSLGHAFGTKKSQKALRSLTENAIVSPEKVQKDSKGRLILEDAAAVVIDTMGETALLPTRQILQDAVDEAKPRPKAVLAAETPSEVYPLEELAGKDILVRLNTKFIQDAMNKKEDILTKLKALRLLLVMVEWRKTFRAGRRDTWMVPKDEELKSNITQYDSMLMAKLRTKFAPELTLTPWHMDNICTHMCALALIVDNFTTDVFDLRHDLGIDHRRITQYFKEIGCRIVQPKESDYKELGIKRKEEANNHALAKLRIPLIFPKMRTAMRKR